MDKPFPHGQLWIPPPISPLTLERNNTIKTIASSWDLKYLVKQWRLQSSGEALKGKPVPSGQKNGI